MQNLINQIGIILNIVGTLLVAFSFGKPPSTAEQWDKKGRKISLAAFLHPKWFNLGIVLLVIGFACMFISTLFKEPTILDKNPFEKISSEVQPLETTQKS